MADIAEFTDVERACLSQLAKQKRSWNPLTRAAAAREEADLYATQQLRFEAAVTQATLDFERHDVPKIAERVAADERRYRLYVAESLALEEQMHDTRTLLRKQIPRVERQLSVIERAGTSQVGLHGDPSRARFNDLALAVDRQYNALAETLRREIEQTIRREQRPRDWSRDMSIGGR